MIVQTSFGLLKLDWERMVAENLFDQWRKLLRKAITDETLAAVLHEALPSGSILDGATSQDLATGTPQIAQDADTVKVDSARTPAQAQEVTVGETVRATETAPHAQAGTGGKAVRATETAPHAQAGTGGKAVRATETAPHAQAGTGGEAVNEKPGESRNGKLTGSTVAQKLQVQIPDHRSNDPRGNPRSRNYSSSSEAA